VSRLSTRPPSLRIAVVADDALVRSGLAAVLEREDALAVTAQLPGDEGVARSALQARAEAVMWDLGTSPAPRLDGLAQAAAAGLAILALVHADEDATDALGAGARGVLSRLAEPARLTAALQAIAAGLTVLDDTLAPVALRPRSPRPAALVEPLTPRESEVLQLLAQGLANKAIAARLRISDHTVKFHVNAVLGKLGARTRTEAIVYAARLGLVLL
jgi:two-component system, NarL family, nitrate/nitrite response regulator NarL